MPSFLNLFTFFALLVFVPVTLPSGAMVPSYLPVSPFDHFTSRVNVLPVICPVTLPVIAAPRLSPPLSLGKNDAWPPTTWPPVALGRMSRLPKRIWRLLSWIRRNPWLLTPHLVQLSATPATPPIFPPGLSMKCRSELPLLDASGRKAA